MNEVIVIKEVKSLDMAGFTAEISLPWKPEESAAKTIVLISVLKNVVERLLPLTGLPEGKLPHWVDSAFPEKSRQERDAIIRRIDSMDETTSIQFMNDLKSVIMAALEGR